MNLQQLNQIKNQVIEKAEKPFEKGRGKNAQVGERREHSGNVYIKTATGWVYQSKSGKHMHYENATKKSVPAEQHHIDLHAKHIGGAEKTPSQSAKPTSTAAVEPQNFKDEGSSKNLNKVSQEYQKRVEEYNKNPNQKTLDAVNDSHRMLGLPQISNDVLKKTQSEQDKTEDKPKEEQQSEKIGSVDKLNEIKEVTNKKLSTDEENIKEIKNIFTGSLQRALKRNAELESKGYRTAKDTFSKNIYRKAIKEVDKENINIDKINFRQADAKKIIKEAGYSAASSNSTAIRGYNTYSAGYEINNNYDPGYIDFHSVSKQSVEYISKKLTEAGIKNSNMGTAIQLHKHYFQSRTELKNL